MKKTTTVLKIVVLLPCLLSLLSCDKINPEHASSSILLVHRINAYTATGDTADFLESDVLETAMLTPTVVSDIITATLEARLKAPETVGPGPSYQNRIVLHSYDVTYTYTDSTALVSGTPAGFSGELSVALDIDSIVDVSFVIVRNQAKNAIPLLNIQGTNELLQVVAT
ncbi:MAG: hypothetical protein KAT69_03040, partial [Candidatus Aminicenantes bacterium]|nr:hypothetical protein [Candidatus Aminicenantes bacterium]